MAKGFKHGSGGGSNPLNFFVVGGTSTPSNPKNNTIWAVTSTDISSWVFSINQPGNPSSGMLWIQIGAKGTEFNALKKNGIVMAPVSAKQYISGEWKEVPAKLYNGAWNQFSEIWDGMLYEAGNQYTDVTGGWGSSGWASGVSGFSVKAPTIDSSGIALSCGVMQVPVAGTANKIDLSKIKTLYVTVSEKGTDVEAWAAVNSEKKVAPPGSGYNMSALATVTGTGEIALNVSSINEGYVAVFAYSANGAGNFKVSKIRGE